MMFPDESLVDGLQSELENEGPVQLELPFEIQIEVSDAIPIEGM
jgi:hypothetical protein